MRSRLRDLAGWAGFPDRSWIAWAVTLYEIVGTRAAGLGRWVCRLTIEFALIHGMGLILMHLPAGWFVIGLGRNGMEYSVLLIIALLCVGFHDKAGARRAK